MQFFMYAFFLASQLVIDLQIHWIAEEKVEGVDIGYRALVCVSFEWKTCLFKKKAQKGQWGASLQLGICVRVRLIFRFSKSKSLENGRLKTPN